VSKLAVTLNDLTMPPVAGLYSPSDLPVSASGSVHPLDADTFRAPKLPVQ
jgi:hypothetical protein